MNKWNNSAVCLIVCGLALGSAKADFTSLYVFGDGVSTTTDSTGAPSYYGNRYCNGKVWIEVLAQWQNIPEPSITNTSFFGHISGTFTGGTNPPDDLLDDVAGFVAPPDVGTTMVIVWVANADFAEFIAINFSAGSLGNVADWTVNMNESIDNHESAINTLYSKGVRTIVMPLAVDITIPPAFNFSNPSNNSFVRARVIEYNASFQSMVESLLLTLPGLQVHQPEAFSFFDQIIADPASVGSINPLQPPGNDPDLYAVGSEVNPVDFDGPGSDYVFWDDAHPSARVQMHLADLVQKLISPAAIGGISEVAGGVEIEVVNAPNGRAGFVEGGTDLGTWVTDANFTPASTVHLETVTTTAPARFFRVGFPVNWVFP